MKKSQKKLECPCCGKQRDMITGTPLLKMQAAFSHGCLPEKEQLLKVTALYLKVGSYQKAAEFVGRARNKARDRGELAALADQITSLKQQIQESSLEKS